MIYVFNEGEYVMQFDPDVQKVNPRTLPPLGIMYNSRNGQWGITAYNPREGIIRLDDYMVPNWAKTLLLLIT